LQFLQESYINYIIKFSIHNRIINTSFNQKAKIDDSTIKSMICEFAKMRFNGEEYKIEIYESRYLWAEVYLLYRIGRFDLLRELLSEYEMFFEFMTPKFKSQFNSFLDGKKTIFITNPRGDDKFKKILFDLVNENAKSDGSVINTAEDYIWLKLTTKKDLKKDIESFENDKIKFMIAVFIRKYKKAIDILLKSTFGVVCKFFLLRELCLEQNLDHNEDEAKLINVFDASNTINKPQLRSRVFHDEASSSMSFYLKLIHQLSILFFLTFYLVLHQNSLLENIK
jgi:hypothetical protein